MRATSWEWLKRLVGRRGSFLRLPTLISLIRKTHRTDKQAILGQYFTREEVVDRVVKLVQEFTGYPITVPVLEPSFGTGNFVRGLQKAGYTNITGYEIDKDLSSSPKDFFTVPATEKYKLVIGNPPFSKYNVPESYYYPAKYAETTPTPDAYLPPAFQKSRKLQIENAFILKSLAHLADRRSTVAFVLPLSFFIGGKNRRLKEVLVQRFSTIVIYQNDKKWFTENIPCAFAIFTNAAAEQFRGRLVLIYENKHPKRMAVPIADVLTDELIPQTFFYRRSQQGRKGMPLSTYLSTEKVKYRRSYTNPTVTAANVIERKTPTNADSSALAITRVGNVSVGRSGFVDLQLDVLNDMFYVFKFKPRFIRNVALMERVCKTLNENQEHFRKLTARVGSKSLKKDDILQFRMPAPP